MALARVAKLEFIYLHGRPLGSVEYPVSGSMAKHRRSLSVISISSNENPIVDSKTGLPIPIIDLSTDDAYEKYSAELSRPPASKKPRLSVPEIQSNATNGRRALGEVNGNARLPLTPPSSDPECAVKPKTVATDASEPMINPPKSNAATAQRGQKTDAQNRTDALMAMWMDEGIEAAIKETSGIEAAAKFRR